MAFRTARLTLSRCSAAELSRWARDSQWSAVSECDSSNRRVEALAGRFVAPSRDTRPRSILDPLSVRHFGEWELTITGLAVGRLHAAAPAAQSRRHSLALAAASSLPS